MKQLTQKLKDGKMQVLEVPVPQPQAGQVLIRNHYSLISAGTEGSTVKTARMGLIGKARERPQQVKQVLDTLMSQGPVQTYRAVMKKLDAYSPLGYSAAGDVLAVASNVAGFQVGDRVACGGLTAAHAEVIAVPVNLCVKLSATADLRQAAYNTLGAIALQGVRQADLRLGETCLVIGLGLLGQLTCLLLRAAGVRVVGVDIDPRMVEIAARQCADSALVRNTPGIEDMINEFTGGLGCDGVIITAAADSLDPINFAGAAARKRGTIVVVGAVPIGFDREPHFYHKELQVRMSCSYGPGRYDPGYEEHGIDYPAAYVRWTENRNMQTFQELLYRKKIDVSYLTTHTFPFAEAPWAYDLLMARSEPFIGILLAYNTEQEIVRRPVRLAAVPVAAEQVVIGFLGAGSYAQSHLLPNLPKDGVTLEGVMTATGTGSRSVGDRFGFAFATGDADDILKSETINTVFIASRHDTHAPYIEKALRAGKHVFVEKPLCLTSEELERLAMVRRDNLNCILMVGYNRRFSPLAAELKKVFAVGPLAMLYRVNAGAIPPDSWIQDPAVGGGRVIGEVCHFIDFFIYLAGSLPRTVYAFAVPDPHHFNDVLTISLSFDNGSIGTISYLSNGAKGLAKERVEVHGHGTSAVLDDFKRLAVYCGRAKRKQKLLNQNKGQRQEIVAFIKAVQKGTESPTPFDELYITSLVTFKILESLRTGAVVKI